MVDTVQEIKTVATKSNNRKIDLKSSRCGISRLPTLSILSLASSSWLSVSMDRPSTLAASLDMILVWSLFTSTSRWQFCAQAQIDDDKLFGGDRFEKLDHRSSVIRKSHGKRSQNKLISSKKKRISRVEESNRSVYVLVRVHRTLWMLSCVKMGFESEKISGFCPPSN